MAPLEGLSIPNFITGTCSCGQLGLQYLHMLLMTTK